MNNHSFYAGVAILLAAAQVPANADQHTAEALKHASEAASSAGDAKAVSEHAAAALKQIEAAKAAEMSHPDVVKKLVKSEAELKDAVNNANRYNAATAVEKAKDAKGHLDEALHQ
jgi:hypothetical protein